MEHERFDVLTRRLVSPGTRRGILTFLAGALGALPLAEGSARKSGNCQPACALCQTCRKGRCHRTKSGKKRCRRGQCTPQASGTSCLGTGTCQNGTCICPSGTTRCGDACVNTAIDARNCGSCGTRCQLNASCTAGICGCNQGTCGGVDFTCCPPGSADPCFCTLAGDPIFIDPTTCLGLRGCPQGTTTCVGPQCQACCPAGSTCDPTTGTCLQ